VSNTGTAPATSAALSDTLPSGLAWAISPAYTGPGTCSISGQTLNCNFGTLSPNAAATVQVAAPTSAANCATFSNQASVNASGSISTEALASITVQCPSLSVQVAPQGTFAQSEAGATYLAVVTNNSSIASTSGAVTVTETAPSGLTLISMAGSGWSCPLNGNTCSRSDSLPPGGSYKPITITVNVSSGAASPLDNQVSVAGGGSASAVFNDNTTVLPFTCAVSGNTTVSVVDVQQMVNEALGYLPPLNPLTQTGAVTVTDIQKVMNAVLQLGCTY
jgi:uncharacterized repeat protein (TIGR01451 family)